MMELRKVTQEEFDAFPRDEYGRKICPTGDYTAIKDFGAWCSFGERCIFGELCRFCEGCSFGEECRFGERCRFGENCRFSAMCSFGMWCRFGERCWFGAWCSFGVWCRFGENCRFSAMCSFGMWCRFGELCRFGAGCSHEGLTNSEYFACDRIGSEKRKTYFFRADEGMFVRAGCFFGTLDAFVERVKEVHGGTKHEKDYMLAVELAKSVLKSNTDGQRPEGGKNAE